MSQGDHTPWAYGELTSEEEAFFAKEMAPQGVGFDYLALLHGKVAESGLMHRSWKSEAITGPRVQIHSLSSILFFDN